MAREKIIYTCNTDYGQYQVIDMRYEGRPARVLFSGDHRAAQSGIARDDNNDLLFDYNQRFLELANGLQPERVLIIGGGAYTLSTALLWALPETYIDVVELDPKLWDVAEAFFGATENDRLGRYFGEGAQYLANCTKRYDMIVLDAFSHIAIPESLRSTEALRAMHRCLKPGGTLAINVISAWFGRNAIGIQRLLTIAYAQFKEVDVFPAGQGISHWQPQNYIIIASDTAQDGGRYLRFASMDTIGQQPFAVRRDLLG